MNRGDIILVDLPISPGGTGREQMGLRPALIVHDNATNDILPVVMIIPFTTQLNALRYPHTIRVEPIARERTQPNFGFNGFST
jgi:mRNA-degrading endonuclease toxin of MazEF toxin-antitoxin module